jgi:hypothetical protein
MSRLFHRPKQVASTGDPPSRVEHAAYLMARYFIFERLESGRLLWMGEATDLEEVEARLEALAQSGPDCEYFAFNVETRTRVKITSRHDLT